MITNRIDPTIVANADKKAKQNNIMIALINKISKLGMQESLECPRQQA
jgi:hypothetical protein